MNQILSLLVVNYHYSASFIIPHLHCVEIKTAIVNLGTRNVTSEHQHPRFKVEAFWDSEAEVWVATSDDVPGLVTEASTIEILTQKLRIGRV